jgi:hypothetical protein
MGGGARQGTIFLTKSWRRHLIKAGTRRLAKNFSGMER